MKKTTFGIVLLLGLALLIPSTFALKRIQTKFTPPADAIQLTPEEQAQKARVQKTTTTVTRIVKKNKGTAMQSFLKKQQLGKMRAKKLQKTETPAVTE